MEIRIKEMGDGEKQRLMYWLEFCCAETFYVTS